jgi:uncharacterized protein YndB with AHSA1/START domain
MSRCRREVLIQAPSDVVWELIADVERHPEWWPRVVDVTCEGMEEGCTYREVVASPFGKDEMLLRVEELTPGERFTIHCLNTGTFVRMALTEARGGTFLEAEMGMEPGKLAYKVFDAVMGKRYFDRWLSQTVEGLERAASSRTAGV